MNIKGIYNDLIKNKFYDNISMEVCSLKKEDNSITIPSYCTNRLSMITKIKNVIGFDIYISPCRIGRQSNYCSKKIINCEIKDTADNQRCPLCFIIDNEIINPCYQLNQKITVNLTDNFVLLPNAYPYLECQFLITTKTHYKQMDIFNSNNFIKELVSIFLKLLNLDDVIFFNGICGNSLDHFHCQYTTSKFPFLNILDKKFKGIYNENSFRGYVLITSDYNDIINLIQKINNKKLTFNFITRKFDEKNLQFIFFIRNCKQENTSTITNLNFGATELSGIIVGNDENDIQIFTEENIIKYIDLTNNIINYDSIDNILKIKYLKYKKKYLNFKKLLGI